MAISKVIYKSNAQDTGTTWVDMTADTAAADKILTPYTAHIANGTQATGTALGSSYTLLYSDDVTVSTSSTSATWRAAAYLDSSRFTDDYIIYVRIRDKAGPRNGYFVGSDCYFFNYQAANDSTSAVDQAIKLIHRKDSSGVFYSYGSGTTAGYGLYASYFASSGQIDIYSRYSSNSLTINGTYNYKVYALQYCPDQGNPFSYSFT